MNLALVLGLIVLFEMLATELSSRKKERDK